MWGVWRRGRPHRSSTTDDEVGEEIRDHLRRRAADLVAHGLDPSDAIRQAAIEFGGIESYKEQARHAGRTGGVGVFFEHAWLEVFRAFRRLARTPIFTLFSIVSIAVGVGVTTAAYAVLHDSDHWISMPDADRVAVARAGDRWRLAFSPSDCDVIVRRVQTLKPVACAARISANLRFDRDIQFVFGEAVTGDYFSVAGVRAVRGRLLGPADNLPAAPPAIIIGERYWRERLGANPEIVGSVAHFAGKPVEVAGIAPDSFWGPESVYTNPTEVWVSVELAHQLSLETVTGELATAYPRSIIGRLEPSVDVSVASTELLNLGRQLNAADAASGAASQRLWSAVTLSELNSSTRTRVVHTEFFLVLTVGLLLAIASTNLANLFLARGAGRAQERAIRRALGASRRRIFAESVVESVVLALFGGLFAFLLAQGLLVAATRVVVYNQRAFFFAPHWSPFTWGLAAGLLVVAFMCFGVLPAWTLSRAPGNASARPAAFKARWIVGQVAVASALMLVSMMCVRQLERDSQHDAGVDYSKLDVAIMFSQYAGWSDDRTLQAEQAIASALARRPEFESVATASALPFGTAPRATALITPAERPFGSDASSSTNEEGLIVDATASIFRTLDVAILRGRPLDDRDHSGERPNVVIGERLALRLFRSMDVLNRSVLLRRESRSATEPTAVPATIVGVAEPTDNGQLYETSMDTIYVPRGQFPSRATVIAARSSDPTGNLVTFERTIQTTEPDAVISSYGLGSDDLIGSYSALVPGAEITSGLGFVALGLAMCGLYGVLLDVVSRRFSEMGVRLALGADPSRLVRMVITQGLWPVLVGLPIGLAIATLGRKLLQGSGVATGDLLDPRGFFYASAPFILAALWACYWPARRASRVDPTIVLRAE